MSAYSTASSNYGTYGTPSDPTSIVGPRIGAWVIDLVIYFGLLIAFTAATGGVQATTYTALNEESAQMYCDTWEEFNEGFCFVSEDADGFSAQTVEGGPAGLAFWLGHLVVYALIQGVTGGSIGKLAVGLRVVDENGKVAGIGRSFVRTIAWILDALTCGLPIIGGVAMVSTKGHRRLGDMIAGTYVVKKSSVGQPITGAAPMPGAGAAPGAWGAPPAPGWPPAGPGASPAGNPWNPSVSGPPVGGSPLGGSPAAESPFSAPSGPPAGDGPTWDPARNAYIQYDRDRSAWLQWDDAQQSWVPISQ
ncbi:MAG TPA: RDD family protein [Acidimicrobiales bacterium]|nr:RDD family protein [Acidimicrobiales bacterium]